MTCVDWMDSSQDAANGSVSLVKGKGKYTGNVLLRQWL